MNENSVAAIMSNTYYSDQDKYIFTNSGDQHMRNMTTTRSKSITRKGKDSIDKGTDSPSSRSTKPLTTSQKKKRKKKGPKLPKSWKNLDNTDSEEVCMFML